MARLFTSGAEWNESFIEGVTLNGATISTANPRTGTYAYRQTLAGSITFPFSGSVGTTYYVRAYMYVSALPASPLTFLAFADATNTRADLALQADGTVRLQNLTTQIGSASPAVTPGTYVLFELAYRVGVGSIDYVEGRIDGVSFASSSTESISDSAPTLVNWGRSNGTGTVTVDSDDIALNDSTGASQTSWPGSGKVVLLKPVSLNTNGGSWTDSAAATTSAALTDALDNTPPTGIADTTANAGHQVRNAAANTSLDMNLATYASAGIGAADTINLAQVYCNTGAPVITGAKTGSLGVASNPTIANIAFVNGGTAAANFWSGVAAGTYGTGWKWEKGTLTYGPSVTVGSSPVGRVTITGGTTSRIAMVDALGMYVDYTPATSKAPPFQSRTQRNFLLRR